jgi:hypothetical protein
MIFRILAIGLLLAGWGTGACAQDIDVIHSLLTLFGGRVVYGGGPFAGLETR